MPVDLRNRKRRLPLQLALDIRGENAIGQTFMEQTHCLNVSGTGICFETRQKLLVNTRLQLSIRIPPSLQKHFGGKAVWETSATVIRLEAMEGQTTVRAGARFIEEAAAIRSSPRKA